jgi:hypothetical protein
VSVLFVLFELLLDEELLVEFDELVELFETDYFAIRFKTIFEVEVAPTVFVRVIAKLKLPTILYKVAPALILKVP